MSKVPQRPFFAQVSYVYLQRKHRAALGCAWALLIRALGLPPNKRGELVFSVEFLAHEIGMDPHNARREWRTRIAGKYLIDTGKRVGKRVVWRVVDPSTLSDEGHLAPDNGGQDDPGNGGQYDPEDETDGGQPDPVHGGQPDPVMGVNGTPLVDIADPEADIPPTPQGALVAPGASPLAPDDEPYSHSCPAPTWVVKRWITWANPGVEAATYEVQRLFRVLPRLAVSWNSYPDATLWRWMFDRWVPGRTKGVNVGVADLCAYLGRAQQERSSSCAPRKRRPNACAKPYCDGTALHLYEGQRWCNGCILDKAKALGKTADDIVPTFERDRYPELDIDAKNRAQEAVSRLRNGHAPVGSRA